MLSKTVHFPVITDTSLRQRFRELFPGEGLRLDDRRLASLDDVYLDAIVLRQSQKLWLPTPL